MEKKENKAKKEEIPEDIQVYHYSRDSINKSTIKPDDLGDFFMYNCLVLDVPILMYLIKWKSASKEELLDYNRKFMLMEMIDLEEKLENLKLYGLIDVKENKVIKKW